MNPKRAALYFRVSKDDQTTENQVPDLRKFVEARGWTNAGEFRDDGVSGAKMTRPALEKMMAEVRHRKFDVVVVWSYDRFARSLIHLVTTLDFLKSLGVDFVSYREQIDTTTPEGRMMFQFFAVMAEFERGRIAIRVKTSLARLKAAGKRLGRPLAADAQTVQDAKDLRAKGYSVREIALKLDVSKSVVGRIFQASQITSPLDPNPSPSQTTN